MDRGYVHGLSHADHETDYIFKVYIGISDRDTYITTMLGYIGFIDRAELIFTTHLIDLEPSLGSCMVVVSILHLFHADSTIPPVAVSWSKWVGVFTININDDALY